MAIAAVDTHKLSYLGTAIEEFLHYLRLCSVAVLARASVLHFGSARFLRSIALGCAPLRSVLRSVALVCARLHSFALGTCARLRSVALVCARFLRSFALNCARLHSFALDCARLRSFALNCARLHSFALGSWRQPLLALQCCPCAVTISASVLLRRRDRSSRCAPCSWAGVNRFSRCSAARVQSLSISASALLRRRARSSRCAPCLYAGANRFSRCSAARVQSLSRRRLCSVVVLARRAVLQMQRVCSFQAGVLRRGIMLLRRRGVVAAAFGLRAHDFQ